MDPTHAVALACDHQSTIASILEWAGGVMPVASAVAWATARWNKIPPGLQTMIQLVAGNFLHAAFGEPTAPQQPAQPATPAA